MWDIFFISYQESNAEQNWKRLLSFHPDAKRLHGIKGIDKSHVLANSLAQTEYFWIIDGDNYLIKELNFNPLPNIDLILFHALDPLHETPTSLGSAKLWKRNSFVNTDMSKGDFTLFSTSNILLDNNIFTINNYNFTPFETWKAAFRHCVKLMSIILCSVRDNDNLEMYLNRWRSNEHSLKLHSEWAYRGYNDAKNYVAIFDNDMTNLNLINDYDWLQSHFEKLYQSLILSEPNL